MHVGYSAFFQNLSGRHTDEEVYRHELALADGGRHVPIGDFKPLRARVVRLWEATFGAAGG